MPAEKLRQVNRLLAGQAEVEAKETLAHGVICAMDTLGLKGEFLLHYMQQTANDLLVRLRAADNADE